MPKSPSRVLASLLFVCAATILGCDRSHPSALGQMPAAAAAPASTAELAAAPFPVFVIDLRGEPAEIGTTHGKQLGPQVRLLQEKYLDVFIHDPAQRAAAKLMAAAFEVRVSPAHRAEIHALAAASGVGEPSVMLANSFLDMMPMTACSTIALPAAASLDGVARFGRNLDFASLGVADKYSVVIVYHPKDKFAFAAVSWPGLVGVLSGMNEHGLALANMEVTRPLRLPSAMPYTLLYRTVLEECRTVNEAIDLLQRTPRQTANNLMLMDAGGDRAVVEIAPDSVTVRRARAGQALISTNHRRGTDLDTPGRCWRYDALHDESARSFGHIGQEHVHALLARVGGHGTLQSMIFEPATRTLLLSVGHDAAKGDLHRLELAPLFAK